MGSVSTCMHMTTRGGRQHQYRALLSHATGVLLHTLMPLGHRRHPRGELAGPQPSFGVAVSDAHWGGPALRRGTAFS